MRVFSFVMIAVVTGIFALVAMMSVSCIDLGLEPDRPKRLRVYVDKQWDKPLVPSRYLLLDYLETEAGSGQWESNVYVMSSGSHINKVPAKFTMYVYPEKTVPAVGLYPRICPVYQIQDGYYRIGSCSFDSMEWSGVWSRVVRSIDRDDNVEIGGDSKQPKIAAMFHVSIPPSDKGYDDLFVIEVEGKATLSLTGCFLVQVVR